MNNTVISASALLRSVLEGMDELFDQVALEYWRDRVRQVAEMDAPSAVAQAWIHTPIPTFNCSSRWSPRRSPSWTSR
jgi:hypothetical protein